MRRHQSRISITARIAVVCAPRFELVLLYPQRLQEPNRGNQDQILSKTRELRLLYLKFYPAVVLTVPVRGLAPDFVLPKGRNCGSAIRFAIHLVSTRNRFLSLCRTRFFCCCSIRPDFSVCLSLEDCSTVSSAGVGPHKFHPDKLVFQTPTR